MRLISTAILSLALFGGAANAKHSGPHSSKRKGADSVKPSGTPQYTVTYDLPAATEDEDDGKLIVGENPHANKKVYPTYHFEETIKRTPQEEVDHQNKLDRIPPSETAKDANCPACSVLAHNTCMSNLQSAYSAWSDEERWALYTDSLFSQIGKQAVKACGTQWKGGFTDDCLATLDGIFLGGSEKSQQSLLRDACASDAFYINHGSIQVCSSQLLEADTSSLKDQQKVKVLKQFLQNQGMGKQEVDSTCKTSGSGRFIGAADCSVALKAVFDTYDDEVQEAGLSEVCSVNMLWK